MTSKRFLIAVFAGWALVMAIIVPFNLYVDIYGVFRPAAGRHLSVYGEERVAKYLHSYRYITDNFDGVLLGSSLSDNLDTHELRGYRVYNASISGGNVEDLRPIADNVLRSNRLRLVIFCLHRYLTQDHMHKTDFMTPRDYWGAFGSPQLLTSYLSRLSIRLGVTKDHHDPWGAYYFETTEPWGQSSRAIQDALNAIARGSKTVENYAIDPVAYAELNRMLEEARRPGRRLLVYYPPVPAPILAARSGELAQFRARMEQLLRPGDVELDFNTPAYAGFRSDFRNYLDQSHLSRKGEAFIAAELSHVMAGPESPLQTAAR